VIFAVLKL